MSDQCKHCTLRGDLMACEAVECGQHDNWYTLELKARIRALSDDRAVDRLTDALWESIANGCGLPRREQIRRVIRKAMPFVALLFIGCGHVRPTISTDARKVIRASDIVNVQDMPEDEAIRVYEATGKYRGLDDDEWIFLIQEIENMNQIKREGER